MGAQEYLREKLPAIEKKLQELVPEIDVSYRGLFEAARYSLFSSGKRIRPILVLASTEAVGGDIDLALTPACSLELIHTYSLIHDDLPCMDDDDYRRGKPTLHKAYSEWEALLTGDFLLTYAFEVLGKSPGLTSEQKLQLVQCLAFRSGGQGMVAGQFLDLASTDQITLEELQNLHKLKTGALLVACMEFGAIVGKASEQETGLLRQFGEKIGLAFQIVDDILDVTAGEIKHGKSAGSDSINHKTTYTTLLGVEHCREIVQNLCQEALRLLNPLKGNTVPLQELAYLIVNRNY